MILEIFSLILLNIFLYFKTINYGLVMDDWQWYQQRTKYGFFKLKDIKNFNELKAFIDNRLYSGTTFGTNTKIEHSFSIFLHTLIGVLMYLDFGHNQISFLSAILYSCNPINNQTSIWLNGRRYTINIILVLLMIAFPIASPVLYGLTGFLQVTAFFSPILLINKSPTYLLLIPLALFLCRNIIISKCIARMNPMSDGDLKTFKLTRLIVIVKTFGFFFWKMLFPQVCAMQYPDRLKWGQTEEGNRDAYNIDIHFAKGIGAIGAYVLILLLLPGHYRTMAVFMGLAILQWSAVLPITQILSDRYCSLPNVFMMFFLSYTLITYAHIYGVFFILALSLYYYICLSVVIPMYKNIQEWYIYHFRYFPSLSWYRHNLIQDLMNEGKIEEASRNAFEGISHDNKDYRILIWCSIMCLYKGDIINSSIYLDSAENNMYINREEDQRKEIMHLREQIEKIKPIHKKLDKMTSREKAIFLKNRKIN